MHSIADSVQRVAADWHRLHWYGVAVGTLLITKLLLSIRRRRKPELSFNKSSSRLSIHGVVTVYNEAPAMLRRCLESILAQTLTPQSLTVVDDCSSDHSAGALLEEMRSEFEQAGVRLDFIRFPDNRGKRHGLAAGFEQEPSADAYLCIDSDTVLDKHAVAELAEPFSKRRVHCVTGLVLAHNRSTNLLTRLIDMRYVNAFLGERVAYSRLGSVLCACGSLAMYRGWVVRKHLGDFLDQRFLGRPATFGDDRRLTYYCLTEGLSLIQPSSVGYTDVPERLGHYVRQQIRWGKSFIREGFLLLFKFRLSRMYWWLNLVEIVTWIAFTVALLAALVTMALHPNGWTLLIAYVAYMCLMAWVRSIHYLRGAAQVGPVDRVLTFLAAPLYALLNLGLLLPLRLWSLATLRSTNWGTRAQVEVGEAASESAHVDAVPVAATTAEPFAGVPEFVAVQPLAEPAGTAQIPPQPVYRTVPQQEYAAVQPTRPAVTVPGPVYGTGPWHNAEPGYGDMPAPSAVYAPAPSPGNAGGHEQPQTWDAVTDGQSPHQYQDTTHPYPPPWLDEDVEPRTQW